MNSTIFGILYAILQGGKRKAFITAIDQLGKKNLEDFSGIASKLSQTAKSLLERRQPHEEFFQDFDRLHPLDKNIIRYQTLDRMQKMLLEPSPRLFEPWDLMLGFIFAEDLVSIASGYVRKRFDDVPKNLVQSLPWVGPPVGRLGVDFPIGNSQILESIGLLAMETVQSSLPANNEVEKYIADLIRQTPYIGAVRYILNELPAHIGELAIAGWLQVIIAESALNFPLRPWGFDNKSPAQDDVYDLRYVLPAWRFEHIVEAIKGFPSELRAIQAESSTMRKVTLFQRLIKRIFKAIEWTSPEEDLEAWRTVVEQGSLGKYVSSAFSSRSATLSGFLNKRFVQSRKDFLMNSYWKGYDELPSLHYIQYLDSIVVPYGKAKIWKAYGGSILQQEELAMKMLFYGENRRIVKSPDYRCLLLFADSIENTYPVSANMLEVLYWQFSDSSPSVSNELTIVESEFPL